MPWTGTMIWLCMRAEALRATSTLLVLPAQASFTAVSPTPCPPSLFARFMQQLELIPAYDFALPVRGTAFRNQ